MPDHLAPVISLDHWRLRQYVRKRRPARIAEPIALDIGEPALEVKYPCAFDTCEELVDAPGFCKSCRAAHAAARIVRGPYRRET